jgi:hypothetical protein
MALVVDICDPLIGVLPPSCRMVSEEASSVRLAIDLAVYRGWQVFPIPKCR